MKCRKEYYKKWYAENVGRARTGYCEICGGLIENNKYSRKLYCDSHSKEERYYSIEKRAEQRYIRKANTVLIIRTLDEFKTKVNNLKKC